jgi:hypothetical protein
MLGGRYKQMFLSSISGLGDLSINTRFAYSGSFALTKRVQYCKSPPIPKDGRTLLTFPSRGHLEMQLVTESVQRRTMQTGISALEALLKAQRKIPFRRIQQKNVMKKI